MTTLLRCLFCRKSEEEVAKLVAGPNVYICDSCVKIATTIIEHSGPSELRSSASRPAWKRLFDRLFARRFAVAHF
jgi:ATP-dependent Clp protease ATP-binding subunit ClpX